MYELNNDQTLLVSGGRYFEVTEEWKQNVFPLYILNNFFILGTVGASIAATNVGSNAAIGGFAIGAAVGLLRGLYRAYSVTNSYEVGEIAYMRDSGIYF